VRNRIHCPVDAILHVLPTNLKDYRIETAEENREINYSTAVRPLTAFKNGVFKIRNTPCKTVL
jgi:hypothetical protein